MKVHALQTIREREGGGLPSVPAASTVGISNPSKVSLSQRDARDARSDVEPQRELTLVEEVEHRPHGKERPSGL